jgi:hypothetical protein
MADLTAMLQAAAGAAPSGYQISRSLRFNSADSAYLNRTPASASNRKTWTWSAWVKKTTNGGDYKVLFEGYNTTTSYCALNFTNSDQLRIDEYSGLLLLTNAVYRDLSAWYHIVYSIDTTQATSSDRVKIYVNGQQVTSFATSTYPSQNYDTQVNNSVSHTIGQNLYPGSPQNFNGYMAEVHFVDGSALTPSSFGEFNATTGVWSPIAYAGSYGTNGFYLNFSDNTSTTTLGEDQAGSNDWTLNNFSVTAGAGNDSLVDTPTQYGTDTGAGGQVRGNYCTGNPLNIATNGTGVLKNGNLDCDDSSGGSSYSRFPGTIGVSSGKWYFEATRTDASGAGNYIAFGVTNTTTALGTGVYGGNPTSTGANANEWVLTDRAVACNNTTYTNLNSTLGNVAQNDVIQICVDMDTKKIWFGKNNTFVGSPSAGTSETFSNLPTTITPLAYTNQGELSLNFGQRPFAYTAPSGFKALVTTNLPEPTVVQGDDYFNTVLYTGNVAVRSQSRVLGFNLIGFGLKRSGYCWTKSIYLTQLEVRHYHIYPCI